MTLFLLFWTLSHHFGHFILHLMMMMLSDFKNSRVSYSQNRIFVVSFCKILKNVKEKANDTNMNNRIETKKFSFFSKLTIAFFATRMYWIKYDTVFFIAFDIHDIYIYICQKDENHIINWQSNWNLKTGLVNVSLYTTTYCLLIEITWLKQYCWSWTTLNCENSIFQKNVVSLLSPVCRKVELLLIDLSEWIILY